MARRRLLWTLGVALALLVGAEVALRAARGTVELPYAPGERAYRALGPELRQHGAASISVVGSSRAREGLPAPVLAKAWGLPRGVGGVANYALAGAYAAEVEVVVRRILDAAPRPDLILYGMSARQLAIPESGEFAGNLHLLWQLPDWMEARRRLGAEADQLLDEAIQNSLRATSLLYSFRDEFQRAAKEAQGPFPFYQAANRLFVLLVNPARQPMRGAYSEWQLADRKRSTMKRTPEQLRTYLANRYRAPSWPNTWQAAHLRALIADTLEAGVPLVLVEVPLRDDLRQHIPEGAEDAFRAQIRADAREAGVAFLEAATLEVPLDFADYRDQSHLNRRGAARYARAVADALAPAVAAARRSRDERGLPTGRGNSSPGDGDFPSPTQSRGASETRN